MTPPFRSIVLFAALLGFCGLLNAAAPVDHGRQDQTLWFSTSRLRIECNLTTGLYNCRWTDGSALVGAFSAAKLADGTELTTRNYARHECADADIQPFSDELGHGLHAIIHHRHDGRPELEQHLFIYDDQPSFVTTLKILNPTPLASNHMAPLVVDATQGPDAGLRLPAGARPRVLFVPFDNDAWVRYNNPHDPAKDPDSYEVTAIYDNATRHGVVLGSITHDLWKTGIEARNLSDQRVGHLRVYGGAAGKLSRDSQPHGLVSGATIASPRIWIGAFADWRDGLEAFGQANARIAPPLAWTGGVVFGWNSWAAYAMKIDYPRYLAASDFLKQHLQPKGFHNQDTVYINWDSGWNKCSEQQLREAARHLHANGQKAGIYWTPFALWGNRLDRPLEGTDGRYTWKDIVLKDSAGNPLPKLDGGIPVDPTHPGTLQRIDWQLARFVDWGYDFVKLDFMNFGVLEGAHYDPAITTGVAAYNLGMKRILADLDPQKIGRPFFISLSIAPLFPAYGHARRGSCDVFGQINDSEYLLNSLTYGWWVNGTLYPYNDPDHIVLYKADKPTTDEEARTCFSASVIAGTVLIDSDDLADPAAAARAKELLTNPQINALARSGHAFRPVEGDTADRAADAFVWQDPQGPFYVAVFNFDPTRSISKTLSLDRLGLSRGVSYRVRDLWTQQVTHAQDTLPVELPPKSSRILALVKE